jgi:hypothetical protein
VGFLYKKTKPWLGGRKSVVKWYLRAMNKRRRAAAVRNRVSCSPYSTRGGGSAQEKDPDDTNLPACKQCQMNPWKFVKSVSKNLFDNPARVRQSVNELTAKFPLPY